MSDQSSRKQARLRAALEEMQLYLSDSIPPLFFAESVDHLLESPPEIVGAAMVGWAGNQVTPGAQLPTADYIFHAAKKLHMLAELELLPEDVVKAWIVKLRPALIDGCPPADRQSLTDDLGRLDLNVSLASPGGVEVVYRRTTGEPGQERPLRHRPSDGQAVSSESLEDVSRSVDQGLRRLDTLLQKLDAVEAQVPANRRPSSQRDGLAAEMVAPDEAEFQPTGKQPTMGDVQTDPEVFREIWRRASAGRSPVATEADVPVDRYCVRALYEHWVTAGILEPA